MKSIKMAENASQNFPFLHLELTPRQIRLAEEIAKKPIEETWEAVAARLGISRRALYSIRNSREIRSAVSYFALIELETQLPSVSIALTNRAIAGDVAAIRVYFELIAPLNLMETRIMELKQQYDRNIQFITNIVQKAAPETQVAIVAAIDSAMEDQLKLPQASHYSNQRRVQ